MKKILFIIFFFIITNSAYASKSGIIKFQEKIIKNPDFNKGCRISNFSLTGDQDEFSLKVQYLLNEFGAIKLQDFDQGGCIQSLNFQDNIFTTHIWQGKNHIMGNKVDLFVTYNIQNKKLMVVLLDQYKNAYVFGDADLELKQALKLSPLYRNNLNGVNLASGFNNFLEVSKKEGVKKASEVSGIIEIIENGTFENKDCEFDNLSILKTDSKFKTKLTTLLAEFGGLSVDDFDMGECLGVKSTTDGMLITKYWQKNKDFFENQLTLYVAYDPDADDALLVILDNNQKSYILGNRSENFKRSLYKNENLKNDYIIGYGLSYLKFDDFKQNIAYKKRRDQEIEEIQNPKWKYNCEKDRFTNAKSCFLFNKDLSIIYLNGEFGVMVGGDHFPGSMGSLKIDNNQTLNAREGRFLTNANALNIINQLKNGKIAYTRYKKWPHEYNIDNEVKLDGFRKAVTDMIGSYKRL